ncbi:MAG: hypothetical protein DRR42_13195 [Gammaproteobacteria bacterium]|nr:MAG: hypothetical protein DRR42_13195 [Gammaproteobacteria bacterium]
MQGIARQLSEMKKELGKYMLSEKGKDIFLTSLTAIKIPQKASRQGNDALLIIPRSKFSFVRIRLSERSKATQIILGGINCKSIDCQIFWEKD